MGAMGTRGDGRATGATSGWSGERVGRLSLRLDAAYCALLGAGHALAAPRIAARLAVPAEAVLGVGVVVVLWAGTILVLVARLPLRAALRGVLVANLAAAAAVAGFSAAGATVLVVASVLAVAADVGLFAGSQAFALRRLAREAR